MLVNVFIKDESKIEELFNYLLEEDVVFDIVGKQALVLKLEDFKKLSGTENGWFDVEQVEEFPEECWEENKTAFRWPASIPAFYDSLPKLPPQQIRPSKR